MNKEDYFQQVTFKFKNEGCVQWLTSVFPATWDIEMRRQRLGGSQFEASLDKS
jgi:hypothetical protein